MIEIDGPSLKVIKIGGIHRKHLLHHLLGLMNEVT